MIELIGGPLYQWDVGRMVSEFNGNAVQFANKGDSVALTISRGADQHEVRIPDRFLATGKPVMVYDVQTGEDTEITTLSVKVFPVRERPKPKDYAPSAAEEAYGIVVRLVSEAAASAESAAASVEAAASHQAAAHDAADNAKTSEENAKTYEDNAKTSEENAKIFSEQAKGYTAPYVVEISDITVDTNNYDAIKEKLDAGKRVVARLTADTDMKGEYQLLAFNDTHAVFSTIPGEKNLSLLAIAKEGKVTIYNVPTAAEVLELIANGGEDNIDMGSRWFTAGRVESEFLNAEFLNVCPDDDEGFFLQSSLEDDEFSKPVANFHGTHEESDTVILRGVADGTRANDAVNKKQLDTVTATSAAVNKLSRDFEKSGYLVQAYPAEGSPLEVYADYDFGCKITVCGKNLYDPLTYPMVKGRMIRWETGTFYESAAFSATENYIPVSHLWRQTLYFRHAPHDDNPNTNAGVAFYDSDKTYISGTNKAQVTVPDGAAYMRFSIATEKIGEAQYSLEKPSAEVEAYSGSSDIVDPGDPLTVNAPSVKVVAFAYPGTDDSFAVPVTVKGRRDPLTDACNLLDELCQDFTVSGETLVQCNPVAEISVKVTRNSTEDAIVSVCGKNLYDARTYPMDTKGYVRHVSGTLLVDSGSSYRCTSEYIPCSHLRGYQITIRKAPADTSGSATTGAGIAFYDSDKTYISGTNKAQVTVPSDACFMRFSINNQYVSEAQIEIGNSESDYEAFSKAAYKIAQQTDVNIPVIKGVNNIFALATTNNEPIPITVTGKENQKSVIRALLSRIEALENQVISNT